MGATCWLDRGGVVVRKSVEPGTPGDKAKAAPTMGARGHDNRAGAESAPRVAALRSRVPGEETSVRTSSGAASGAGSAVAPVPPGEGRAIDLVSLSTEGTGTVPAPKPARAPRKPTKVVAPGTVTFVGTGPGDPDLLTLRAVAALKAAKVLIADRSVPAGIALHLADDTEIVEAVLDDDGMPYDGVGRGALLAGYAKQGRDVVRLVHGDAVLDPGVPQEALAVRKAKVSVELIPGVPAATGIPAYAGVPLVEAAGRGFRVVDAARPDTSWVGDPAESLVILNAGVAMPDVAVQLVAAGRSPRTPVALVRRGTRPDQQTTVSTLAEIARDAAHLVRVVDGGELVIVGDVAAYADRLGWWETRPLAGWNVLVPRTKEQAGPLSTALRRFGAEAVEVPTISVEPPRTPQQMDKAIQGLVSGRYLWVVFTSANAVRAVAEKFTEYGLDARALAGIKVAAVGEQTALALSRLGVNPDLVPSSEQSSAGLVAEWPAYDPVFDPIDRVFLPRADIATESLVTGLHQLGWQVDDITAYRTVRAAPPSPEVRDAIKSGGFDAVVFTSSSTVRNLVGIAGKPHQGTVVAVIGPATEQAALEHGLRVDVISPEPSITALARALAEVGGRMRTESLADGRTTWRPSLARKRR